MRTFSGPSGHPPRLPGLLRVTSRLALAVALALTAPSSGCSDASSETACATLTEGCACPEGACEAGLSCEAGRCVLPPAPPDGALSDATLADLLPSDPSDSASSDLIGPDSAAPSCDADPVPDFCPCESSADCASGFCLPSSAGGDVCSRTCDQSCPEGFECRFVTRPDLDPTYLCVEPDLNLCRPCTTDLACQQDAPDGSGARCVRYGDAAGSFCGAACGDDGDCPSDYACREVEAHETGDRVRQCVLAAAQASCACSGRAISGAAFTTCTVDRCDGTRRCEQGGLTACLDADGVACAPSVAVTVSFDAQGGQVTGEATRSVWLGEPYGPLPEATRDGHALVGWRTAPGGGGEGVSDGTVVTVREPHTLFAAWQPRRYLVSFDSAGGSPCEAREVTFGAAYGAAGPLCAPTRPGYAFDGWRFAEGEAATVVSDATEVATARNHTLIATWSPSVLVITFDSEGGSSCPNRGVTHGQPYGASGPLCAPTRPGFTFGGWHDGDNGTGHLVTDASIVTSTSPHVLHARWTPATFSLSFDPAGGAVPVPETRLVTFGAPYGTLATTSRAGYVFAGWWTRPDGGGAEVTADTIVSTASDHALHALWRGARYTVRFDSLGGNPCDSATVTFGAPYGPLCQPSRPGFVFDGWVLASGAPASAETLVATASDHRLEARWTARTYLVGFDPAGGSAPAPATLTVTFAAAYGALPVTTREGHDFAGWWTAEVGGREVTPVTNVATAAPHTLHARWTPKTLAVTYDGAGGAGCESLTVTFGAAYGANAGGLLCVPVRAGYAFGGWALGAAPVTAATVVVTEVDHTLTARWTARAFPVAFDSAGGGPCPDATVTFGAPYGALCATARVGHRFEGWWTGAGGAGERVTAETVVATASAHVLHALWEAAPVRVTFEAAGGAPPNPASREVTFGAPYGPLAATSREGHDFGGWWSEAGDAGEAVTADSRVTRAEPHALFARWTPARATVAYDSAGGTPCVDLSVTFGAPYGASVDGALCAPTRLGFSFLGWVIAEGGDEVVTAATRVTVAGDHVLRARWGARTFALRFDGQGGTACAAREVTFGGPYGDLCEATRTGYAFDGWRGADGAVVAATTTVDTPSDHTLRAAWVPERYTVWLDPQGGVTPRPDAIAVTYDASYGEIPETRREGYAFGGWWTTPAGEAGGVEVTPGTQLKRAEPHTLHARWVANGLTVTYDNGGGTGCATAAVVFGERYDLAGPLCTPRRPGYDFAGWGLGDGGEPITGETIVAIATDHVLRAAWTPARARLGFDSLGGSPCVGREVVFASPYGDLCASTRTGYTLAGWTAPDGSAITAATPVATPGDHALTARWDANRYAVTFEAGEGTAASPPGRIVVFGEPYGDLAASDRVGYILAGWRTAPLGGGDAITPSSEVMRAAPHTLHADWTPARYTLGFDSAGGTPCQSRAVTYDAPYGPLCATTRAGYTFAGWALAGGGAVISDGTIVAVANDHVLAARWTANAYLVTFDARGGVAPDPGTRAVTFGGPYGALPATSRLGHTFGGWWTTATTGGAEVLPDSLVARAEPHSLFARWTAERYTVTYASGGGSPCAALGVTWGEPYGVETGGSLCQPIRPGYVFAGWWTAETGGAPISADTIVAVPNDHLLHARWAPAQLTVSWSVAGGEACDGAATSVVTFGEAYGPSPCATGWTGYAFEGWFSEPTGGAEVGAETVVTTPSDHSVHARWRARSFAVTWEVAGGTPCAGAASSTVTFGAPYGLSPCATTREGHSFAGWWTAPAGGEAVDASTRVGVASDHALHARWAPNTYVVTHDVNGGVPCEGATSGPVTFGQAYGASPCNTRRDGFSFAGWWTAREGGVEVTEGTPVTTASDHRLFARWLPPVFVRVEPGLFTLGSPAGELGRDAGREARAAVRLLRGLRVGETEVTQGQWRLLSGGLNPSASAADCGESCPVEGVTWWSALGYANALSAADGLPVCYLLPSARPDGAPCTGLWQAGTLDCGEGAPVIHGGHLHACAGWRLPTEAEWEYVARAGSDTATPGGDLAADGDCAALMGGGTLADLGWYACNSGARPRSVRRLTPNAFGLFDTLGNVAEWTWDRDADGGGLGGTDPQRGEAGGLRIVRGGSFADGPSRLRAASREAAAAGSRSGRIGLRLVRSDDVVLPAGRLTLGAPAGELGREADEGQVEVTVTRPFRLDPTEVTLAAWKALSGGVNPAHNASCDSCPVESVTWWSALAYANARSVAEGLPPCYLLATLPCVGGTSWQNGTCDVGVDTYPATDGGNAQACRGYRLPTEAEWEHAARAGSTAATFAGDLLGAGATSGCVTLGGAGGYAAGTQLASLAWHDCNSGDASQPVRARLANPWGLHDLLGNVWEWTWDRYESASALGGVDPMRLVAGVGSASSRVYRGGSFANPASSQRSASRAGDTYTLRNRHVGFRLARTIPACADGLDNDGDGRVDHAATGGDPGCSAPDDMDERGVRQVATGARHSCAILDDGAVKCWGVPTIAGELGYEDVAPRGNPGGGLMGSALPAVALGSSKGAPTRAVAISASLNPTQGHTCLVTTAGTVKCWGANGSGQLGYGDQSTRGASAGTMGASLEDVALAADAVAVAAGGTHTCAALVTGAVQCWGAQAGGALGQGTATGMVKRPTTVDLGAGLSAVSVGAGQNFACALLEGGGTTRVKCWGQNNLAQLGLGDLAYRGDGPGEMGDALPALELNLPEGVRPVGLSVGWQHACASLSDGTVKCWGENANGQLGRDVLNFGTTGCASLTDWPCPERLIGDVPAEMASLPPVPLGAGVRAAAVSANGASTCALTTTGQVRCWGSNSVGHFGAGIPNVVIGDRSGEMGDALAPTLTAPRVVEALDGGANHQCLVFTSGDLACLGERSRLGLLRNTDLGYYASELGANLPVVPLW